MKVRSIIRQLVSRPAPGELEPSYKELDSRLIKSTRYDLGAQRLYIRFLDGREMVYCRVTPYAYNAFLNADSFSDHFFAFIHMRYLNYPVM
ncbi:KTSC domain-containing protein [Brevibacillus choshinensis]|uniref:KTSC domain-containing protein n=1 Tax=Brevibacillus choshinensis TaxID=54911 RepID=UPI002E225AB2|nr:KTSC domain-containing protein [Brevibacillus choshinensis]MED4753185.1 KTSC domain-containing protein [Brevibacillus choshinensis]MED4782388.1 KTSC domain-containing protein [Brevibacillus choshinensis]